MLVFYSRSYNENLEFIIFYSKKKNSLNNQKLFFFIEKIVGLKPKNLSYYQEAFTHRSFNKFTKNSYNYERLEFLGDSILGTVVSEYLFNTIPFKNEGYLTQMRSKIVNRKKLNLVGTRFNFKEYIRFDKSSCLGKDIYGNIYESLIGAIFLDYGMEISKKFIYKTLLIHNKLEILEKQVTSYKSLLLEYSQKKKN